MKHVVNRLDYGTTKYSEIVITNENLESDDKFYSLGIFTTQTDFITVKQNEPQENLFEDTCKDVILELDIEVSS